MLPRVIFCTAVSLAILAVILLALLSPVVHKRPSKKDIPWLALSLYIQQPHTPSLTTPQPMAQSEGTGAFVFHRTLTEGPENTSRVVGKAQGFIIPMEHFAHSDFNIICLTFDTPEYLGSLSVQAKQLSYKNSREELTVVGGTGSFAFARGRAIFAKAERRSPEELDATYHVKLHLKFPNQSQTIPG
ncbi:Dirigent protein [Dillenia turbinata]|uniref:Dirigent protein n=1 Tax=Dillenia turbinata TaxID=194707 RepID=A0AAN8U9J2_9MAGN